MHPVIPDRLWVGSLGDVNSLREFLNSGGRALVQLAYEDPPVLLPRDLISCRIPLIDGAGNDPAVLRIALDSVVLLVSESIPTLVACGGGMSRSPCIVAAALSLLQNRPPDKVLREVTRDGPADVSAALWDDVYALIRQWPSREHRPD